MITGKASITAKICAFARAHHSINTVNPIFDDYLANELLGTQDYNYIKEMIVRIMSDKCWDVPVLQTWDDFINQFITPIIISRSEYTRQQFERYLESIKPDEKVQYVVCGAGLDSFMFRNANANVHIFELDHPDTQVYKKERIENLGWSIPDNGTFVSMDFTKQSMKDALLGAGFNPQLKSFFAIMGVTYYLTLDIFAETVKSIAQLMKASSGVVTFDYPDKDFVRKGRINQRMESLIDFTNGLGEHMQEGMNFKELADIFQKTGLYISDYVTPQVIQEHYFEDRDDRLSAYENVSFITATKLY